MFKITSYHFDTVDSTNRIAWELLEQGHPTPLVAIAKQQTAGRGQWGRTWESEEGGLYLSLALNLKIPAMDAAHITLFSAWGIGDNLRRHQVPVWLKWPNDLILLERKLGGIKSETRIQKQIITQSVIGVGINWSNPVPEIGINLQSWLNTHHHRDLASLEDLATLTHQGILSGFMRYQREGIGGILADYQALLHSMGKTITIDGSPGVIVGVTPGGELRVRLSAAGASTEINIVPGMISLGYNGNQGG